VRNLWKWGALVALVACLCGAQARPSSAQLSIDLTPGLFVDSNGDPHDDVYYDRIGCNLDSYTYGEYKVYLVIQWQDGFGMPIGASFGIEIEEWAASDDTSEQFFNVYLGNVGGFGSDISTIASENAPFGATQYTHYYKITFDSTNPDVHDVGYSGYGTMWQLGEGP